VATEVRQQIVQDLAYRPGTACVEYKDLTRKTSDHGWVYISNGEEEVTFSDERGDNRGFY
jgi:hypothetical protein